jgi:hypothetical protein
VATITTDTGDTTYDFPAHTVYTAITLASAVWVEGPMYCLDIKRATNAFDVARIVRPLGVLLEPGETSYATQAEADLTGRFVKIAISGGPTWFGYISGRTFDREADDSGTLTGRAEVYTCVGFEYFLARVPIDTAVIYPRIRIGRPLIFNGGKSSVFDNDTVTSNNAHNGISPDGKPVFADYSSVPVVWNADMILRHLLFYHVPFDRFGANSPLRYELHTSAQTLLNRMYPAVDVRNLTTFQALNRICSAAGGLVWWGEFVDAPIPRMDIYVQSVAPTAVNLYTGGTLPANSDKETLDFDSELDVVGTAPLVFNRSRRYTQVKARGARMTSTFTIGLGDSTLEADWESAEETAYKDAAKNEGGYPAGDDDKAKRNDAYRKSDKFYRVYGAFRIPKTWDGKSGDGSGATKDFAMPILSINGSVVGGQPLRLQGLRLLNHTRLVRGSDYSDTQSIVHNVPTGSSPEYMPPLAIMQVTDSPTRYQKVEAMRKADWADGDSPAGVGRKVETSYTLRMQQSTPGVLISSHGMPHACAYNHWAPAEPTHADPEVDYDTLRVTVCGEADSYCEGVYPSPLTGTGAVERLTVDVGKEYRLDYLAANTVFDIDDGSPVTSNGGVLRDDRRFLTDIAQVAYEWYRTERASLTVQFRQLRDLFTLGSMITTIGTGGTQETINTVVTMLSFDVAKGVTTLSTSDITIDFAGIFKR